MAGHAVRAGLDIESAGGLDGIEFVAGCVHGAAPCVDASIRTARFASGIVFGYRIGAKLAVGAIDGCEHLPPFEDGIGFRLSGCARACIASAIRSMIAITARAANTNIRGDQYSMARPQIQD